MNQRQAVPLRIPERPVSSENTRRTLQVPHRGELRVLPREAMTARADYVWRPPQRNAGVLIALHPVNVAPLAAPLADVPQTLLQPVEAPAVMQAPETVYVAPEAPEAPQTHPAQVSQGFTPRKRMALLLPGHNEELIIATTIRSAVAAGQDLADIYVVDDGSTDATPQLATELLGAQNVLSVERSGKALAVQKAIAHFGLAEQYEWLHVADADSVFSPNYFVEYRKKLATGDYAIAVGFVQSMRGNWISTYRAVTYTYSQHVTRRVQSRLGMISVFPGPITAFRTDVLPKLDFSGQSLTEDFDITLQVHRKKLGQIAFIPRAVNYTQDPNTLKDFWRQNMRWQRGFFQGVKKYRIGTKAQRIDLSIGWQMFQSLYFLLLLLVIIPALVIASGSFMTIPVMIAADIIMNSIIMLGSSVVVKRWNLLGSLPYFYFLRWVEIAAYFTAFFEVMVLRKFRSEVRGWATEGRRYKLSNAVLAEAKIS